MAKRNTEDEDDDGYDSDEELARDYPEEVKAMLGLLRMFCLMGEMAL